MHLLPPHQPDTPTGHRFPLAAPAMGPAAPAIIPGPLFTVQAQSRDWKLEQLRRERDAAQAKLAETEVALRRLHLASGQDDLHVLLRRTATALHEARTQRAKPRHEWSAQERLERQVRRESVWPIRLPVLSRLWDRLLVIAQRHSTPAFR